jgi:hypothetical protein
MKRLACTAALLALFTSVAEAQLAPKSFSVTTRMGMRTSEVAASLDPAAVIGLDTEYAFNRYFGIGTAVDVARGNVTNEHFLVRLRYGSAGTTGGDSLYYQYLGQSTNTVSVNAFATLRYPGKRVSPFLMGGAGTYALLLDPQLYNAQRKINEMSYIGGAGVWLKLSEKAGIQLDVRNMVFTKYNRDLLNPAFERDEQNTPFPEDFPVPPANKSTVGNLTYTLGFRYIPGGLGGN